MDIDRSIGKEPRVVGEGEGCNAACGLASEAATPLATAQVRNCAIICESSVSELAG